jgi:hypothetical protein
VSFEQERANEDKLPQAMPDNASDCNLIGFPVVATLAGSTFMLRSAGFAFALLILAATAAPAETSSCGQGSELAAARQRWAAARQARVDPADAGKTCRAYGNNFYEAVQVRYAASLCDDSVHRQRSLNTLDAEIDAFNNLIAAQCTGS